MPATLIVQKLLKVSLKVASLFRPRRTRKGVEYVSLKVSGALAMICAGRMGKRGLAWQTDDGEGERGGEQGSDRLT